MLAMLVLSADRRMWNWRLLVIWSVGSFITFLLMFGQLHIPLEPHARSWLWCRRHDRL